MNDPDWTKVVWPGECTCGHKPIEHSSTRGCLMDVEVIETFTHRVLIAPCICNEYEEVP